MPTEEEIKEINDSISEKLAKASQGDKKLRKFIKQLDKKIDQLSKEGTVLEEGKCESEDT